MVKAIHKRDDSIKLLNSPEIRKAELAVKRLQAQANELKVKLKKNQKNEIKKDNSFKLANRERIRDLKRIRTDNKNLAFNVATLKAKIRTAKAKARAVKYALQTKARRAAESKKAEIELEKAIAAFVVKWKRKRE